MSIPSGSPLRIGFIGLGEHQCRAHIKHLVTLAKTDPSIQLVAGYDPNGAAFDAVAAEYGVTLERFASDGALLASGQIDAVFISSPDEFHAKQLASAVEGGLDVFCEKPVAVSEEDTRWLSEALLSANARKLVVSSCHPRRFDPPFLRLKEMLPSLVDKFGALTHFDFSFWYHEVVDEWKKDRSLLSDHYGHEIDLLRFLTGASLFDVTKVADGYDFYEVVGQADALTSFRFMGSRALPESVYNESVRLDFRKGAIFINLNTGEGVQLPSLAKFTIPGIDYDARFLAVNRNFVNAVRGTESCYLSPGDIWTNNFSSVKLTEEGRFSSLVQLP